MNMDRLDSLTIYAAEGKIPDGRRAAGRMAFLKTFTDLFTYRNPIRKFQDAYRFNLIRWSASNLHAPSWRRRIGLLLQTKNPFSILRDDYRMNRNHLINNWEMATINDINRKLTGIGRRSLHATDRATFKLLNGIEKQIKRLEGYNGCPDMKHERMLLAAYRYILSSPFERKFGQLSPDDICDMLQQNGVSASNLPYQNYENILQGREAVTYELATRQDGSRFLCPSDHVRLNPTPEGSSMELISRFPQKEVPMAITPSETIRVSEKIERAPRLKEAKRQQHSRKGKANSIKIK